MRTLLILASAGLLACTPFVTRRPPDEVAIVAAAVDYSRSRMSLVDTVRADARAEWMPGAIRDPKVFWYGSELTLRRPAGKWVVVNERTLYIS